MKITTRTAGDVTIMEAKGKLNMGDGDVVLRDAIRSALAAGRRRIVLDLGGVSYMDSSGIGELVSAYTTVTHQGGAFKILNLSRKVSDVLQITQLITVFEVYDDEQEALASF